MSQSNELLNRINERYSHMSKGQKMLSTYITDNYDKAVFLTADKLGIDTSVFADMGEVVEVTTTEE